MKSSAKGDLPYLSVGIEAPATPSKRAPRIFGLLDTGASHTLIRSDILQSMEGFESLEKRPARTTIVTATGKQAMNFVTTINMTFTAEDGSKRTLRRKVYAVDNLTNEMLIGGDIIWNHFPVLAREFVQSKSLDEEGAVPKSCRFPLYRQTTEADICKVAAFKIQVMPQGYEMGASDTTVGTVGELWQEQQPNDTDPKEVHANGAFLTRSDSEESPEKNKGKEEEWSPNQAKDKPTKKTLREMDDMRRIHEMHELDNRIKELQRLHTALKEEIRLTSTVRLEQTPQHDPETTDSGVQSSEEEEVLKDQRGAEKERKMGHYHARIAQRIPWMGYKRAYRIPQQDSKRDHYKAPEVYKTREKHRDEDTPWVPTEEETARAGLIGARRAKQKCMASKDKRKKSQQQKVEIAEALLEENIATHPED